MRIDRKMCVKPRKGDRVLNARGETVGIVAYVRATGEVVWTGSHGTTVVTRGTWDEAIEFCGYRFERD